MATMQDRYAQFLEFLMDDLHRPANQFETAICLTQLGRYTRAQYYYGLATQTFLVDRFWYRTGQPHWLVDNYAMAGQRELYPQVFAQLESYKQDPRGRSPWALYSYAAVRLLAGQDEEAQEHVAGLLEKPKIKDTYAMGQTIQAIVERAQSLFDSALKGLLKAHRGQAKFGGLRESAEGFLCLPAMTLSRVALERGMEVKAESEYLSQGYLRHLLHDKV